METIQHQPKAITPCIRLKVAQSAEISRLVDEYLNRGGSITKEIKPSLFLPVYGRKPDIEPFDTKAWKQKDEMSKLMVKNKILSGTIARKLKMPPKIMTEFFNGLRFPSIETQERIMKALDELIVGKSQ